VPLLAAHGECYYGFALRRQLGEELIFDVVGDGHLAGGDLVGGGSDEAELAVAEDIGVLDAAVDVDGRAEDAAGHGAAVVDVAESGGGVERGTGRLIGKTGEAGAARRRIIEEAGGEVAGEIRCECLDPGVGALFNAGGARGIPGAERIHAVSQAERVKGVDGEGSVTALGAAWTADEPVAGAGGGVGQGCVDDLHENGVSAGDAHEGKDSGSGVGES